MSKFRLMKCYVCLLLSLAGVSAFAQDNVIDEVVWVVGDEAILKSDGWIVFLYPTKMSFKKWNSRLLG